MTTVEKLQQHKTYQNNEKESFSGILKYIYSDFQVEKIVTGKCTETMERVTWDVMEFYDQMAQIRLVDNSTGIWGHINFDDLKGDITCVRQMP